MSTAVLPYGCKIFTTMPDVLFIPELVCGGLVWILIACTHVFPVNFLGWVMAVSVFCFLITIVWLFVFLTGGNQRSNWPALDVGYHAIAVLLYFSASVLLILSYLFFSQLHKGSNSDSSPFSEFSNYHFKIIATMVMTFITTLFYFIHAVCSARRWKSS